MQKERPVARNGFALALLTALALGGCSTIKGALGKGDKEEKAAQAKLVALRARTDSLRKARYLADSLEQVRFTACADSIRTEMTKPIVMKPAKKKSKKKAAPPAPSDELIASQVHTVCGEGTLLPQTTVATTTPAKAPADSSKHQGKSEVPAGAAAALNGSAAAAAPMASTPRASANQGETAPQAPATPAPALAATAMPAAQPDTSPGQDPAVADSVQKAKEMEMTRETFAYSGAARDPFSSLLNMAKNGPELADLQLVGIYQNLRTPNGSVAVFREKDGGKRHKLRAGDQLGRSRLVQIREREVVFVIEDFGFERQETLSLRKQEDVTP
jgi:hypothetical protein